MLEGFSASDAEADIVAFIEQQTGTNYHPTSTCVLDTDLRVFGTEGLRMADGVGDAFDRTWQHQRRRHRNRGGSARERARQGTVITGRQASFWDETSNVQFFVRISNNFQTSYGVGVHQYRTKDLKGHES
jgi:GMC oxidoreductase